MANSATNQTAAGARRDKPAVAAPNVEVADEDHEEEEPIVAEPVRVYPEANIPELSERERYAKYVLGPIRRK